jgi:hypothetical protein
LIDEVSAPSSRLLADVKTSIFVLITESCVPEETKFFFFLCSFFVCFTPLLVSAHKPKKKSARMATIHICAWCGTEKPTQRCSKCHMARYCGTVCQRAHWQIHRPACLIVTKQISADEALEMQNKTMTKRFNEFTSREPVISMMLQKLCDFCARGAEAADATESPPPSHLEVAKSMIPVVCLNETNSAVCVRMAPRLSIHRDSVARFQERLADRNCYACLLELYPWTATVGHMFVTMNFEVNVPADQAETPAGKMTLRALAFGRSLARQLMNTAAQRAEGIVFQLEKRADGSFGFINEHMVLVRRQIETLFIPARLVDKHKEMVAMATAELQPAIIGTLSDNSSHGGGPLGPQGGPLGPQGGPLGPQGDVEMSTAK